MALALAPDRVKARALFSVPSSSDASRRDGASVWVDAGDLELLVVSHDRGPVNRAMNSRRPASRRNCRHGGCLADVHSNVCGGRQSSDECVRRTRLRSHPATRRLAPTRTEHSFARGCGAGDPACGLTPPGSASGVIVSTREEIAEDLWCYGEPELAVAMLDVDEGTHHRIVELAASPRTGGIFRGSRIDALLAAAAVDVLTNGQRRKPQRRKRLPEFEIDAFWSHVGRDRDTRDPDDPVRDTLAILERELGEDNQ